MSRDSRGRGMDHPTEPYDEPAIEAPKVESDSELLDELGWNGCLTGDCPHQSHYDCDKALADHLREALKRREGRA